MITELAPTEVFVFGANASGFHGAGSAGYAFRGTSDNNWRQDSMFMEAYKQNEMFGVCDTGKWAVFGKTGLMQGREGMSYGVITTEKAGYQGFVNTDYLSNEISKLIQCCHDYPQYTFRCCDFGRKRPHGYSWWTKQELIDIWNKFIIPGNLIPSPIIGHINNKIYENRKNVEKCDFFASL